MTFENKKKSCNSSLHRTLREGHRRPLTQKLYASNEARSEEGRESHRFFVLVFLISQLFLFRGDEKDTKPVDSDACLMGEMGWDPALPT